jgi:hypothetical protein
MMNGSGNGQGQAKGKEPVERVMDLFVHMPIGFAVMAWKRVPEFVVGVPELVGQALSKGCAQIAGAEERLSEEVRKARMIGQVAVTFGGRQVRREVDARLADARRKAEGVASFLPGVGADGSNGAGTSPAEPAVSVTATPSTPTAPAKAPTAPAKAPTARAAAPRAKAPTKATGARKTKPAAAAKATKATGATKPSRATAAKPRAPRPSATPPVAPASAADLPIREYDGLSASQVVSRLTGLTPEELRAVRGYEEGSRGRRTVILAIDRLLE